MAATDGSPPAVPCDGLIGLTDTELSRRLGEAVTRMVAGGEPWLVLHTDDLTLRVRCAGPAPARVASWTATFTTARASLREAALAVGLWPMAAPDEEGGSVRAPLIRRPITCPISGVIHSLTATVRDGRITQISVFDEPPDWL